MHYRAAAITVGAAVIWFSWPRPDAQIRIALGGIATLTNAFGLTSALGDTLRVGGGGARRTVRVINADTLPHVLAMFSVNPNSQQDFSVPPGVYEGTCSVHKGNTQLTVLVR
ncbi:MAG: hypothetical protein ABMA00_01530 [Gemmatimonas sp.]